MNKPFNVERILMLILMQFIGSHAEIANDLFLICPFVTVIVHIVKKPSNRDVYTSNNNMDPGDVPFQLQDLTYIEQMLIARVHPVISLYRIKGCQYSYSGN